MNGAIVCLGTGTGRGEQSRGAVTVTGKTRFMAPDMVLENRDLRQADLGKTAILKLSRLTLAVLEKTSSGAVTGAGGIIQAVSEETGCEAT